MRKKILVTILSLFTLTGCGVRYPGSLNLGTAQMGDHNVTLDEAKEIALTHAGLSVDDTEFVVEKFIDANPSYYLNIMKNNDRTYVYKVETSSGKVLVSSEQDSYDDDYKEYEKDAVEIPVGEVIPSTPNTTTKPNTQPDTQTNEKPNEKPANKNITADQAFEIALKDAGVSRSSVTEKEIERDKEDNILVYEVEFKVGKDEYDYDIAIADGRIVKKSIDLEKKPSSGNAISISKAKELALAKVPGANNNHIEIERDTDDGRVEYEGTIIYNGYEYEFEIDGHTGKFLEWEVESIYD